VLLPILKANKRGSTCSIRLIIWHHKGVGICSVSFTECTTLFLMMKMVREGWPFCACCVMLNCCKMYGERTLLVRRIFCRSLVTEVSTIKIEHTPYLYMWKYSPYVCPCLFDRNVPKGAVDLRYLGPGTRYTGSAQHDHVEGFVSSNQNEFIFPWVCTQGPYCRS
jgi:hypothetical protein